MLFSIAKNFVLMDGFGYQLVGVLILGEGNLKYRGEYRGYSSDPSLGFSAP